MDIKTGREEERESKQETVRKKRREACFPLFSSQQCSRRQQADRELL